MNQAVWVLTFGSVLLFAGCGQSALLQMRRDNVEAETRIASKQQELTAEEDQRAALSREQKNLLSELDNKQVTLNELNSGLDRLRKENARLKVDNERQQKEKQRMESEIRKFQAEISRLNSDAGLSDKVKRERIESLKKQIKTYLELMLTQ